MDTTGASDAERPSGSAADRAYRFVKRAVLARQFVPNQVLSEGQIADAVGVSRTPVREALLRLQAEGMLQLLPKRGALVLPVTAEERADVLEARRLIESFAVRKVIAAGPVSALVADLRPYLDTMRAAMSSHDTATYVEADRGFHAAIVAASGNAILVELYRSLRDRQLRMGAVNLVDDSGAHVDPARMRATLAEHTEIANAIAARSVRAAEAAVAGHLEHSERLLARRH